MVEPGNRLPCLDFAFKAQLSITPSGAAYGKSYWTIVSSTFLRNCSQRQLKEIPQGAALFI